MFSLFQEFANGGDGVPVSRRGGERENFLDDSVGVEKRAALVTPKAEGEAAAHGQNPDFPIWAGTLVERERREFSRN